MGASSKADFCRDWVRAEGLGAGGEMLHSVSSIESAPVVSTERIINPGSTFPPISDKKQKLHEDESKRKYN